MSIGKVIGKVSVASVEQTDENQANSMLLVGVIDLILNDKKYSLADKYGYQ